MFPGMFAYMAGYDGKIMVKTAPKCRQQEPYIPRVTACPTALLTGSLGNLTGRKEVTHLIPHNGDNWLIVLAIVQIVVTIIVAR